ncbi:MAG: flagellar biosynthetic protein FliR [Acidobacteriota bacterium]
MFSYDLSLGLIVGFLLTVARVGGLVTFAPFFGGSIVPMSIRLLLTLGLTWAVFPAVMGTYTTIPTGLVGLTLLTARELLVGLVLGFSVKLVLAALDVAGQLMGFQLGFSFIQMVDPQTQVESPFMASFLNLIAIMIFLGMDGHHWLIEAVVQSYQVTGPDLAVSASLIGQLVTSLGQLFILGLQLSAPIVVMLFIVDVLFGILGRAAPQIHILIVGLPAKSLIGFTVLTAIVYSFIPFLGRHLAGIGPGLETYLKLLRG